MLMSTRLPVSFAAALFAALSSARALAADYHVATAGSDTTGDGSASKPWATIGHAASRAAAGDTVHIAPGTYAEAVNSNASGTASQRIRFVSDVRWGAKVNAAGHYTAWQNDGDYVDIVGFDVTGADYLGVLNLGSFVRVMGNHVHHLATPTCNTGNGGAGIDHGDYTKHDNDTVGNLVDHIADGVAGCEQIHGIYHSNLRGHIWNNIVGKIGGYCIHDWHASADVVIANNLAFSCGAGGVIVGDGDSPGGVSANNFVVSNNIILDSPVGIIESGTFGTNNKYLNNLIHGCATPLSLTNAAQGTLSASPMLVDYKADATGDYHLQQGSPCLNAGVPTGAPPVDMDGVARPQGSGFDIGPYELCHGDCDGGDGGHGGGAFPADAGSNGGRALVDASGQGDDASSPSPNDASPSAQSGGCRCVIGASASYESGALALALALLLMRAWRRESRAL